MGDIAAIAEIDAAKAIKRIATRNLHRTVEYAERRKEPGRNGQGSRSVRNSQNGAGIVLEFAKIHIRLVGTGAGVDTKAADLSILYAIDQFRSAGLALRSGEGQQQCD